SLPLYFRQGTPASPEFIRAVGDLPAELRLFFRLGVDGVFSDNPDTAVATPHPVFGRSCRLGRRRAGRRGRRHGGRRGGRGRRPGGGRRPGRGRGRRGG